ncbi:MAG: exodeoxyribonuclease VII small subunit [Acetatifactor sp.]|nr:exodeoxyribonuclease VII small subunit [Acetatifactor sp.]
MSDEKQDFTLEENFERLEETIEQLEQDDLPLEDAFKAYTLGMQILKQCNDQIDKVEKQVLKLSETGELEELDHGDTEV